LRIYHPNRTSRRENRTSLRSCLDASFPRVNYLSRLHTNVVGRLHSTIRNAVRYATNAHGVATLYCASAGHAGESVPGTARRGGFHFSEVPAGTHALVVRKFGHGPLNTTISFAANRMIERDNFLTRIVMLDSMKVMAERSVLPSFEESRKHALQYSTWNSQCRVLVIWTRR